MSEAPVLEAAQRKLKAKHARLGIESARPPSQNEAPQLLLPQDPQASAIQGLEIADARSDPYATLVPEGDYHVIYLRFERGYVYGRAVWFCHFRISEGEHAGRTILRFYNQPKGSRLARTSALWRDFVCLTGRRPAALDLPGCSPIARSWHMSSR